MNEQEQEHKKPSMMFSAFLTHQIKHRIKETETYVETQVVPGTTEEETEEGPSVLEQVRSSEEAKRQKKMSQRRKLVLLLPCTVGLVAGLLVVADQTVGELLNAC